MKTPDLCSVSRCRKPTYVTLEGKPYCEDHFNAITENKKKEFEEFRREKE